MDPLSLLAAAVGVAGFAMGLAGLFAMAKLRAQFELTVVSNTELRAENTDLRRSLVELREQVAILRSETVAALVREVADTVKDAIKDVWGHPA